MQNKTVIITGASKGIGRSTALEFAAAGYDLVIAARSMQELEAVQKEVYDSYQQECLICCGSLEDPDFVNSIPEDTLKRFGRIDALINNAAWRTIETMRTMDLEIWDKTINICLTAPAFLAKNCAAIMEKQGIQGVIINVSSIMSQQVSGNSPAYIACKGALESLTKELAVTYGRSGIRFISIKPGYIDTDLSTDYSASSGEKIDGELTAELLEFLPLNRPGHADETAKAIRWLASAEAGYLTGCELVIDGGLTKNLSSYRMKKMQFPEEF